MFTFSVENQVLLENLLVSFSFFSMNFASLFYNKIIFLKKKKLIFLRVFDSFVKYHGNQLN